MNAHALRVLEFGRVVELVAGRAVSDAGAARIRSLAPNSEREWLEREHARVAAARALRASEGSWGAEPVPSADRAIAILKVVDAAWSAAHARDVGVLLQSAARARAALHDPRRPAAAVAVLAPVTDGIATLPEVARAIARAIDEEGNVRDEASPKLRSLRRETRDAEGALMHTLERAMRSLDERVQVPDASISVRNGRYVIPVRREGRSSVGGIVHDTSATGATLFVEPPAAIEAANRIRELEIDTQREIDRILRELTETARPHAAALDATLYALAEIDSLAARARFADDVGSTAVQFGGEAGTLVIREGRHPLLLAKGDRVVPFDLVLQPAERTLLVSGPNTGGKTVLLKAVGLFQVMAQSGMPIPVGAGTVLPVVDDVFADVGDEQSIEASLSTFSAHITNLGDILAAATRQSLVLIDELGSGTDPAEGAALGAAILERLTGLGARTVATTHLGALKDLPLTVPGVVNASLQFDEAALAPTYRLLQGIPGRSYGLSIARRLELPADVIERAEARVPEQERAVTALLAELEHRDAELAAREAALNADEARTHEQGRRVAERERSVRERERAVERSARAEARRYLLDARAEIERTIAAVRSAADSERAGRERDARRAVEQLAGEHAAALSHLDREEAPGSLATGPAGDVAIGDIVSVASLGGKTGRVVEVRDDEAVVAVGAVKVSVPRASLARSSGAVEHIAVRGVSLRELPDEVVPLEVDLRGVRVADVDEMLFTSLDSAVRADLKSLRIIHGKGTGALRERVAELLRKDVRVRSFRLGAWNEGGAGVTVAEFQ